MAKPILHNDPTSIHIVRQVVAQQKRVRKYEIAERHHDVVWLKLRQRWRVELRVEKINRNYTGFGRDLGLKLSRLARIGIDD